MRIAKTLLPLLVLTLLAPRGAAAAAGPWSTNPQSSVRLITPWQVAPRASGTGELRLGLHFKLTPGWHVYWKNSGDAGFPPVVVFGKTPGLQSTELLWPAPQRFELRGGLVAFGYETEVVYPVRAELTNTPGDRLHLSADVDYLVCEVDCVPYRYTLTADQPLGDAPVPDPATAPLVDAWWKRLPVAAERLPGVTTSGVLQPGATPSLEVTVHGVHPAPGVSPGLFLEAHDTFDAGRPEARTTDDGVVFRVPLKPHEVGKPLPRETVFAWTVTGLTPSLEAKRTVPLGTVPAAPSPAGTPAADLRSLVRPIPGALLAVAATLAALWLWGLLGSPVSQISGIGREALGFAAAAVLFATLWGLSRQVSFVGLAWIELLLLAMALCAWLRRRAVRRPALSFLLALGCAACALAAPWLAHLNRLT
ncbi:MAG TPA: protein-disulfide reductase DsbD domain-containing protein [Thermoanaerobaculia bacterium]|jgi:DsbC/DsbD-like thiol-disulfide interchange protein|nr:protein-disulfide reductase DsbD domain-containing protein [Thermoanaerobaculia bacterium]